MDGAMMRQWSVRLRVLIILAAAALCNGQSSSTISLSNGVRLQVSASFGQPTGQATVTVQMARASGSSFYRIFRDQNQLVIFAYELAVDLTPGGDALNAFAKPATEDFAQRFPDADAGKPTPTLSSEHALGPLASGQAAEIALFEIPGMGLDVHDAIQAWTDRPGEISGLLRFSSLRVAINGKTVAGPSPGAVSGRFAMFYIPGRGGYFFTTDPTGRGFIKTGTIDRDRLRFAVENDNYDCLASAPIVNQAEGADVWVYHDPAYQPTGTWTHDPARPEAETFFAAAADSLSWWLP